MRAAWGIALCVGCYHAPTPEQPCSISCTDTCPGDLTCEGGYCVQPGEVCHPTFAKIAAGNGFACAIDDLTALWCWGSNRHHVVDPGMQMSYSLATRASGDPGWQIIDGGGGQVCGIRDGRLFCWGQNDHGEVALGTPGDVPAPKEIAFTDSPSQWTAVSAGDSYTCAIGDGKLYCWGRNYSGRLGLGVDDGDDHPATQVGMLTDWTAISAGEPHTCGISASMGMLCWGSNAYAELGPNATGSASATPVAVPLPGKPSAIAVNYYASCATVDGTLYCWGDNSYAELGDPKLVPSTTTRSPQPVVASDVTGWTQVAGAGSYTCGLAGDAVYCWGQAQFGGLGNGAWAERNYARVAMGASALAVGWNKNVNAATGNDQGDLDLSCVLAGGDAHCWGDNRFGQLGTGTATMALAPTEVAGQHTWSTLELGTDHSCGLDAAGALYCWGSTLLGEATGVIAGTQSAPCSASLDCDVAAPKQIAFVPTFDAISLGPSHTCALAAGALNCWGDNSRFELGSGGGTSRPRLVAAPGAQPWTSLLTPGNSAQCARLGSPEQVYCWGDTLTGNMSMPARFAILDGATALIAPGGEANCFLDPSSTLFCQGQNNNGQFGDDSIPTTSSPVTTNRMYSTIASTVHNAHACGLRLDGQVECWGRNQWGQSGQTDTNGQPVDPVRAPYIIPGLSSCTEVTASTVTSCAVCGGEISCWGLDAFGGIGTGQGLVEAVSTPRQVSHVDNDPWIDVRSGDAYSCGRTQSGRALCWGLSTHGGLGSGVAANQPTTVLVSMPQ
jgi:alpha-tubulin suppressor-like RCC1 family protein